MCLGLQVRASFFNIVLNSDHILEQYANETSNVTDRDGLDNQDCEDGADESTASSEEDPDNPMSVEARVSLAQTYHMPLLVAPWVWILIGQSQNIHMQRI